MEKALITKIISKNYTIRLADGSYREATLAGKMRRYDYPVVGDIVEYRSVNDRYIIERFLKRKNYLLRPNLANIDQVIIVMSTEDPTFSYELCNRMIMLVEYNDIKPVVCISKKDLSDKTSVDTIKAYYSSLGYVVYDSGLDDPAPILDILKGKITVLCGQSGVGKSTLLNGIDPLLNIKTQAISKALNRGKHTTRHVQLYEEGDGLLADTPGFSSLDLTSVDKDLLATKITAFKPYVNNCRFIDCRHLNEPDCSLKEAVEQNLIPKTFYDTYYDLIQFLMSGNIYGDRHRTLK